MIKCALFDLDGTLVNTITDLGRAADYTLDMLGFDRKWTADDYRGFVGNGVKKLLDRAFEHSLDEKQLDAALEIFRKRYNEILLDNAVPYDGICEVLNQLHRQGISLAVVTNKPHEAAVYMVENVFGKDFFDLIIGATEDLPKKPDPYTTDKALATLGVSPEEAVYFGDSDIDVYTARNAGVLAVACSWGFRSRECLLSASPDRIIDSAENITDFFN